jgi:hypothetical protein
MSLNEESVDISQLNLGQANRNAGRDYYEMLIPGSIKLVLATQSRERLNEMAQDNNYLFKYRFGFEATTPVRKQIIDMINRYDFSDKEIRILKRSGQLVINRADAKLKKPSHWVMALGWFYVGLVGLAVFARLFTLTQNKELESVEQALQVALTYALFALVIWVIMTIFILPGRILKQSGVDQDD